MPVQMVLPESEQIFGFFSGNGCPSDKGMDIPDWGTGFVPVHGFVTV
jgi:hypothetical protein